MFNLNENIEFASGKNLNIAIVVSQNIEFASGRRLNIPMVLSQKYFSESDTSTSSADPNIGAHRSGDTGRLGAGGGHGAGGPGVGGRGVGQMAPMLKPRLGDMYQEESEEEGQFNLICGDTDLYWYLYLHLYLYLNLTHMGNLMSCPHRWRAESLRATAGHVTAIHSFLQRRCNACKDTVTQVQQQYTAVWSMTSGHIAIHS